MARNSKSTATENRAPDFIAWHVTEKGGKSFWSKTGASWLHKDGHGMTLQLEVLPAPVGASCGCLEKALPPTSSVHPETTKKP
jgi:hypothetical protein